MFLFKCTFFIFSPFQVFMSHCLPCLLSHFSAWLPGQNEVAEASQGAAVLASTAKHKISSSFKCSRMRGILLNCWCGLDFLSDALTTPKAKSRTFWHTTLNDPAEDISSDHSPFNVMKKINIFDALIIEKNWNKSIWNILEEAEKLGPVPGGISLGSRFLQNQYSPTISYSQTLRSMFLICPTGFGAHDLSWRLARKQITTCPSSCHTSITKARNVTVQSYPCHSFHSQGITQDSRYLRPETILEWCKLEVGFAYP